MSAILEYLFEFFAFILLGKLLESVARRFLGGNTIRFGVSGQGGARNQTREQTKTVEGTTARDPVCGMFVSTELSHRLNWHGELLHFCSEECLQAYRKQASA